MAFPTPVRSRRKSTPSQLRELSKHYENGPTISPAIGNASASGEDAKIERCLLAIPASMAGMERTSAGEEVAAE